jgi:DNA-binding transcriptional ArsR family regulator
VCGGGSEVGSGQVFENGYERKGDSALNETADKNGHVCGNGEEVGEMMPDEDILCDLAEFFRVFGDTTRIKILYALFESEMCVCDIASAVGMTQSAVSHQLRILKANRLVKYRREGKTIFYALADDHVKSILGQGFEHIEE